MQACYNILINWQGATAYRWFWQLLKLAEHDSCHKMIPISSWVLLYSLKCLQTVCDCVKGKLGTPRVVFSALISCFISSVGFPCLMCSISLFFFLGSAAVRMQEGGAVIPEGVNSLQGSSSCFWDCHHHTTVCFVLVTTSFTSPANSKALLYKRVA